MKSVANSNRYISLITMIRTVTTHPSKVRLSRQVHNWKEKEQYRLNMTLKYYNYVALLTSKEKTYSVLGFPPQPIFK